VASSTSDITKLHEFTESELVLGLVCAVGTDLSQVIVSIKDRLKFFRYESHVVDISKDILEDYNGKLQVERYSETKGYKYDENSTHKDQPGKYEETHELMDIGNHLRKIDRSFIAATVIDKIREKRKLYGVEKNPNKPIPKMAYIIKSLKNEGEIQLLSSVYKDGFYLFSIFEDEERRKKNLTNKAMDASSADNLMERDEDEKNGYGQQTKTIFQMADFFVNNGDGKDSIQERIIRIVDLIFGNPFWTPTFGEYAMFSAYCASLRTADLSRQIGAVICRDKDILASGANECPQYGGGLYWLEYNEKDNEFSDKHEGRDYKRKIDRNRKEIEKIASKTVDTILEQLAKFKDTDSLYGGEIEDYIEKLKKEHRDILIQKVKTDTLGELTEYGRMVHAEMEALSVCGRNGIQTKETKLYSTTFPCHVCTKHLVAAGVIEVIYIEPYPKSKSIDMFSDSVSMNKEDEGKKMVFRPFFGVGPRRYIELFSMKHHPLQPRTRKNKDGITIKWEPKEAVVRNQMLPSSYLDREVLYALSVNEELYASFTKKSND